MKPVPLSRLAEWVDGRVVGLDLAGDGADSLVGPDVQIDSRQLTDRALFVALVGEHSDGHTYVARAHAAGAAAALVARELPAGGPQIVVDDPVAALADLGRAVLAQVRTTQQTQGRPPLQTIAITGSSGKTSVKDLLAQLLEPVGTTVAPHGSFNNEIGVPLTASRVEPGTRFLISEMGARGIGHIRYLCDITPPEVAVVLNVGQAHVGEFGSADVTALAKGELVEALGTGSAATGRTAVLNASDHRVRAMAGRTDAPVIWFTDDCATHELTGDPTLDPALGCAGDRSVWTEDVTTDEADRPSFTLHLRTGSHRDTGTEAYPIMLQLTGRHQVANAAAAAAAALACGLTGPQIAAGLGAARSVSRWRMEIVERPDGLVVVNDAYNANPDSMAAALGTLATIGARRGLPTAAVLGDMLELGGSAAAAHRAVGELVHRLDIGLLVTVGDLAHGIADGAVAAGLPSERVVVVQDEAGLGDRLVDVIGAPTVVLVKASRGMALETVAEALLGHTGGSRSVAGA